MYHYNIYGLRIQSDCELPLLTVVGDTVTGDSAADSSYDVSISEGIIPTQYKRNNSMFYEYDSKLSLLSNSACFLYIQNGKQILYEKKVHPLTQYLDSYLMGWGLATIAHQKNGLAIHGSCLYKNGKAFMLSGQSGSGKSTVTTALLEKNYEFMADDMACVFLDDTGIPFVSSAFPYQKLCRDIALQQSLPVKELKYIDETKDKFLYPRKELFHSEKAPLSTLFILGVHDKNYVSCTEITGIRKWYACMDSLFLKGLLQEKISMPCIAEPCLKLASFCRVYEILRPLQGDYRFDIMNQIETLL